MKKAHVTHPELKCTFCLDILGVKKNPNGTSYTQLGVVTKGTIIEVSLRNIFLLTSTVQSLYSMSMTNGMWLCHAGECE